MPTLRRVLTGLTITSLVLFGAAAAPPQSPLQGVPAVVDPATFAPLANRIDPYVPKPRLIVLTDIANEPDDQMSLVRLLVSSMPTWRSPRQTSVSRYLGPIGRSSG